MDIRPRLESYSLSLDMALVLPMLEGFGPLVLSPSKYERGAVSCPLSLNETFA